MEFILKNAQLKEIDKEIFALNKEYGMALESLNKLPNIYAAKEIIKNIDKLRKKIVKLNLDDEFDILYVKNSLYNFEAQEAYLEYFTTAEKEDIDGLMKKELGDDIIDVLKRNCQSFDYKAFWEYYLSYQEYTYRKIPSDDEAIRETLKKILADLKKDTVNYAAEFFNFPKDYQFDLILGQPYSRGAYFHPTNRRMEVSPEKFFVFKNGEKIKINNCIAISVLFHELVGHGRHEINSRNLPLALQNNSINVALSPTHIHAEGVSQICKDDAIDFMKKYKDKYNIEDDFIKQEYLSKISESAMSFWVYYQYLQMKKLENDDFNVEEEFKKVSNNHGMYLLYSTLKESPISCIRNANYVAGLEYMNNLLDDLKKEFGEEYFEKNRALINQAISYGLWHFKVLPDFVRLFLKRHKK
ncbi:hypothetical protein J4408_00205 [Candidatus Pacearchaeota archaeon]|nr:hypothetical protein [Candidatus Pacearchaeota archaeon]